MTEGSLQLFEGANTFKHIPEQDLSSDTWGFRITGVQQTDSYTVENQLPLILAQRWELQLIPTARATNLSGLPPAARGSCCRPLPRALLFLALLQQKAAASHLAAHSTPATGQLCLLSL